MNTWILAEIPRIGAALGRRMISTVILPEGDGHPIIVYPGFTTSNKSTAILRDTLAEAGHNTHPWNHERNTGMNEELYTKLVSQVDELYEETGEPISLVGHSLGGTIARAVSNMRPTKIRRVITVGSPINGIDDALDRLRPVYDRYNGADTIDEHWNQYRDIVTRTPVVPCTSIYSTTDGVVKQHMSTLVHEPLSEDIVVRGGHFSMMVDPAVIQVVATELVKV